MLETALLQSSADVYQNRFVGRTFTERRRLKRRLNTALSLSDDIGNDPKDAFDRALAVLNVLIADCDLRAYDTRRVGKRWGGMYYLLGVPAAVLATIAGATGLASTAGRVPAAIIALVSAGLTTATSFLNSSQNKVHNTRLSADWQNLADDARTSVLTHIQQQDSSGSHWSNIIHNISTFNARKGALLRGDLSSSHSGSTN